MRSTKFIYIPIISIQTLLTIIIFWLCFMCMASGILVLQPRIEPHPLHWKCGILTTEPPRKPLLLLLSRFSRVWLCATPQTAAHQAPLSLGFSRQEHWSGLPFPSPMHAKLLQSCPTLCDLTDSSPPGSSVHRIL